MEHATDRMVLDLLRLGPYGVLRKFQQSLLIGEGADVRFRRPLAIPSTSAVD